MLFILLAKPTLAYDYVESGSAKLFDNQYSDGNTDTRVQTLRAYLNSHDSPLADYSSEFISYADKYELDWRFVVAISGVESTFGKRIPTNSYNAYGWANGSYKFSSWEESIEIVNKTLKEKYIDKGADSIDEIARIYAPPSKTWSGKVKYFMNKIDPISLEFTI